tara:strand:+ start:1398 stop:1829 length:432 start_codon:yes stop_codon:yes gene_type:complete
MKIIEIHPGLWLGDEKSAVNQKFIKSNHIEIIINCNKYLNYSSHKYKSPIKEKLVENEIKHTIRFLLKITEYIYHNSKNFHSILIYCHNQFTISITVIIAFYMRYMKMSKDNVILLLKTKIPTLSIANVANQSLLYYEKIIFS